MVASFKNKRKSNMGKQFLWGAGGGLILLVLIILIIANINIYQKRQEYLAQVASLQKQIKDIQSQNDNLQQGINSADDSQYIEKVAREQLDLQKPGEKAVSFVMPDSSTQKNNSVQKNNWQAWLGNAWNWIIGK